MTTDTYQFNYFYISLTKVVFDRNKQN